VVVTVVLKTNTEMFICIHFYL